jgi:hypothetical protein
MKRSIVAVTLVLAMGIFAASMQAKDTRKEKKLRSQLVGTWRQVSQKVDGYDRSLPQTYPTYKHITPAGFIWLSHDIITGTIIRTAGGTYTLKGNIYTEKIEYGMGNDFQVIKKTEPSFTAVVKGDKWYHKGQLANGQTIDEVWERVLPGK